jgi:VWFA-related protein
MVVTDAKGNVVTDLKKDDFHVTESNEPQTVLNFEPAGAHTIDPNIQINSTNALDILAPRAPVNIVLLDEFNTRFEDMAFARYSLKKFLERQPGKLATHTMLIAVDLQHFTVLQDYTQNKDDLIFALDHHFSAYPWQAHQFAWLAERYATAFITLRRVAEAVIGHPGHKNMIWIGRGFPNLNLANYSTIDTEKRLNSAVQETVNILRDARITLYTIDPAGLQSDPQAYGSDAAFTDPFGGNYQFAKLATATGGKAIYGRSDVDAEILTAIRDGASFYTLTYRPTNTSNDLQKFRRIKVTVDRPGLTVTTREGYYLAYGPGRVDPQKPSRMLVNDLLSAESSSMVYDGLPIDIRHSPATPDTFSVHIDAKGIFWTYATDTDPRHTDLILMAT